MTLHAGANDGVFYATGNTLVPLKETTVRLKKEILNLERKGEWMQVDIYFEFFNPGPEKELTVGFVTPPGDGDVSEEEAKHPFVKDFMVMAGDRILPWQVAKMESTGFKVDAKIAEGYDFIYHFKIKFAKGITVIRHSYMYKGGASVEVQRDFDYRLTTGVTWANSAIEDFELNINMGDDAYFAVPAGFGGAPVNWTLVGVGRLSEVKSYNPWGMDDRDAKFRMVYTRKGRLQLRTSQFKPTRDLSVNIFQLHNEVNLWGPPAASNDFAGIHEFVWGDSLPQLVSRLSDQQLRMYRNLNYARRGYDFKDEGLKKAFAKYNWYLPDPALKLENIPDYYVNKDMMQLILAEEKKRKMQSP